MLVEYAPTMASCFVIVHAESKPTTSLSIEVLWRDWQFEVIRIGTELEREVARLKTPLPAEMVNDPDDPPQTV
jgi:hypothetical protein